MEHPNIELMRRYLDCWARGDVDAATEFWADDVVLYAFGRGPLSGVYRGKKAYRGYVDRLWELTAKSGGKVILVKVHGNLADDERAVNLIRVRFERPGRDPVEFDRTTVFVIRNGKIVEEKVFDQDQYAFDEFLA